MGYIVCRGSHPTSRNYGKYRPGSMGRLYWGALGSWCPRAGTIHSCFSLLPEQLILLLWTAGILAINWEHARSTCVIDGGWHCRAVQGKARCLSSLFRSSSHHSKWSLPFCEAGFPPIILCARDWENLVGCDWFQWWSWPQASPRGDFHMKDFPLSRLFPSSVARFEPVQFLCKPSQGWVYSGSAQSCVSP